MDDPGGLDDLLEPMDLTITFPERPSAPWLRLAHLARYARPGAHAGTRRLADWEFLVVIAGSTWIEPRDGGRIALPTGAVALIPPGLDFDWGVDEHMHLAVHFEFHPAERPSVDAAITYLPGTLDGPVVRRIPTWTLRWAGGGTCEVPLVRLPPAVDGWRDRFAPLLRLWASGGARTPAERLRAAGILGTAMADWLALGAAAIPDAGLARVRGMLDRLSTNPPDRRVSIPALAKECGLGEGAFRAAVHAITGLSPRRWLERRRILAVTAMLADPAVTVAEAAALAGYDDAFHFARVVRRVTGKPPSALRR